MGSFTEIDKKLAQLHDSLSQQIRAIRYDLNKLRGIVKDSKREKLDDIQRQVNKLQNEMDEKCLCNEGITTGKEFDSNCPIHRNMEDAK